MFNTTLFRRRFFQPLLCYLFILTFTPVTAFAETWITELTESRLTLLYVLPGVTFFLCFVSLLFGELLGRISCSQRARSLLLFTTVGSLGNFYLRSMQPPEWFSIGLPLFLLGAATVLLLSQVLSAVRVIAALVLVGATAFAWTYPPQYHEVSLQRFDSTGKKVAATKIVSYGLRALDSFHRSKTLQGINHRLVATSENTITIVHQSESRDGFSVKQYTVGQDLKLVWDTSIKGQQGIEPKTIVSDGDGGIFIAGDRYAYGKGKSMWWVKRLDQQGVNDGTWDLSESYFDTEKRAIRINSIAAGPDNSLYLAGVAIGELDKPEEEILYKFQTQMGTVKEVWRRPVPTSLSSVSEACSIVTDSIGHPYVFLKAQDLGAVHSIHKMTLDGEVLWSREVFTDLNHETAVSVVTDRKSSLYIMGTKSVDGGTASHLPLIKKFDLNGQEDLQWNKSIDLPTKSGFRAHLAFDAASNVFIAGYQDGLTDTEPGSWWLKKYQSDGVELPEWNSILSKNSNRESISTILSDSDGSLAVIGQEQGVIPILFPVLQRLEK